MTVSEEVGAPARIPWWQRDHVIVLFLVLVALLLRCWNLSSPYDRYFDEVYYVRAAGDYIESRPDTNSVHPPLGKILIAVGMEVWWGVEKYVLHNFHPGGESTIAWRFGSMVFGLGMIPLTYYFGLALFRDRGAAALSTFFLVIDFLHIVQSRIGMLDMFQSFFILWALLCTWLYIRSPEHPLKYSLTACIVFALGVAVKWNTLFAMLGALIGVAMLKTEPGWRSRLRSLGSILGMGIVSMVVIYFLAFLPLVRTMHLLHPTLSPTALLKFTADKVESDHKLMWTFRHGPKFEHRYISSWWEWPTDRRPVWYVYRESKSPDYSFFAHLEGNTLFDNIIRSRMTDDMNRWVYGVVAMGSPFVWYLFLVFLANIILHALFSSVAAQVALRRTGSSGEAYREWRQAWEEGDEKALLYLVLTYLPQVLLWKFNRGFIFYLLPCTPLMSLLVGYTLWDWRNIAFGKIVMGLVIAVAVLFLILFYPLLVGYPIPKPYMYNTLMFGALKKFWI